MYLVLTGETAVEGPKERRLEGEDCLQMGTHTQTRYWPHKVCTVVTFSLTKIFQHPHMHKYKHLFHSCTPLGYAANVK